jgi:hypothetical protein
LPRWLSRPARSRKQPAPTQLRLPTKLRKPLILPLRLLIPLLPPLVPLPTPLERLQTLLPRRPMPLRRLLLMRRLRRPLKHRSKQLLATSGA